MPSTPSSNSRFWQTSVVTDGTSTRYGTWVTPRYGIVDESLYVITERDLNRPDLIAFRAYGTSDLWWSILYYNHIVDPFSLEVGDKLKIPAFASIVKAVALSHSDIPLGVDVNEAIPAIVKLYPPTIPVFQRRIAPNEEDTTPQVSSTNQVVFVYGFTVPQEITGNVDFQVQASPSMDFSTIALNKFTIQSQTNWFYYDPAGNAGAGGFIAFPSGGIDGARLAGQTVYLNIVSTDGLAAGAEYYVRYRAWVANTESDWIVSPPILF